MSELTLTEVQQLLGLLLANGLTERQIRQAIKTKSLEPLQLAQPTKRPPKKSPKKGVPISDPQAEEVVGTSRVVYHPCPPYLADQIPVGWVWDSYIGKVVPHGF